MNDKNAVSALVKLIRPHQWVKNGFVFLPMFFSGNIGDLLCYKQTIIAFLSFSLAASAIYCLNDLCDVEADRAHPKKRFRPIAAGDISEGAARVLMVFLAIGSLAISLLLRSPWSTALVFGYMALNVAYCYRLKHFAIVDVFVVASGFVLRLLVGGIACAIWLSPWIVSLTFLLALFLAFAKRRDDVLLYELKGVTARRNIRRYNVEFLDQTLGIIGGMTMICYVMYSVSPEVEARLDCRYIYATSVFVLAGILRYLQVAIVDHRSGSPTKILIRDRFIQVAIAAWVAAFVIILYI